MFSDKYIIDKCFSNGRIRYAIFNHLDDKYPELKTYIENRYNDSYSLKESLVRIFNHIDVHPKCKFCGKDIPFRNKIKKPFGEFCSKSCAVKLPEDIQNKKELEKYGELGLSKFEKTKRTLISKYGVDNIIKLPGVNEKRINTNIEKYGGKSPMSSEKVKRTWKENFKNTHGCEYPYQDNSILNKTKEKIVEKYGVDHAMKLKTIANKQQNTMIKKYGVKCIIHDKQWLNEHPEIIEHRYESMKKNGTLNTSKEEQYIFNKIKLKFEVLQHYKDKERYPFVCDFYIPSLDLFIEYQGSMFHNNRPYLGTEDDLKEIEEIKQKSEMRKQITGKQKTRYDSLIETWTIRDVKKRKIAKQNNLNYLEFFNLHDFDKWFEKQ